MLFRSVAISAILTLANCAQQYAEVKMKVATLQGPPGIGALASAENEIQRALQGDHSKPLVALGDCVEALDIASRELHRDPANATARRDYNFALSRIFEIIKNAKIDAWSKPLTIPSEHGDYLLSAKPDPRPEWNPALYDFTPADQFDVNGRYVTERTTRAGLGAPLVAAERVSKTEGRRENFVPSRIFRCVTPVARFQGRRCVLTFHDPLDEETVRFDGHTFPLAADFTVPLAVMLQETDPAKTEFWRVINPEKYAHTATIERLQPYDPDKTIVLVVHGLMDSQATWTPMINKLRGDPVIRKNYQFWFYSYPSGYPYPYSAAILRHQLDEVEKRYPARKPMVVIGHSMGGCISRLLLTDSGDQLAKQIFGKPLDEVPLSPHTREYFRDELVFTHRPEIGRVIFIASPLRGCDLARSWFGHLCSYIIRPARLAADASSEMLNHTQGLASELKPRRRANSVDTLTPESRFVKAINTLPLTPGVPYHTIIGDRGRGDSPNSSDGVVPYSSSHMNGSQSERIVPSDHSAHQNPEAINEVLGILKAHASR
ncbi:MAG: alpha/beta hydrolase [Luteolibacter sp.]|uniref:esterase/lipase family protein n=1 Tax=Luteolibacter sp. TaxID=1962973 RepID=UPI003265AEEB